eukprot:1395287-Amorphochlora_amoeboformis.AAC.1
MDVSVAEKAIERLLEPTAGLSGWLLSLNGIIVDVVRENEGLTREECAKSVPGGLGVVGYYSTEQIPDRKALGCRVDRKAGTISFFMDGKPSDTQAIHTTNLQTSYTPVKPSPLLSVTYVRASIRRTLLSLSPASLKPLTSQIRSSKLLYSPETQTLLTSDEQWNAFLFQDNKDDVKSRVVHEVVLGIRGETGAQQAPAVSFGVKGKSIKGVEILLDGVVAVKPGDGFEVRIRNSKVSVTTFCKPHDSHVGVVLMSCPFLSTYAKLSFSCFLLLSGPLLSISLYLNLSVPPFSHSLSPLALSRSCSLNFSRARPTLSVPTGASLILSFAFRLV